MAHKMCSFDHPQTRVCRRPCPRWLPKHGARGGLVTTANVPHQRLTDLVEASARFPTSLSPLRDGLGPDTARLTVRAVMLRVFSDALRPDWSALTTALRLELYVYGHVRQLP